MTDEQKSRDGPEEKPGYWAILPASVRYDERLPANAKLLYAEISSLTDQRGYCWASNAYFAALYGVSERTIIRLLRALESCGLIRIENSQGGKEQRKIYGGVNPLASYHDKNVTPTLTKMSPPPDKNVTRNKKDTKKENEPPKAPQGAAWEPEMFERFWTAYPCKKDKASARREWDRLEPDRKLMWVMSAALERQKRSDEWRREIGIPYACRWLKNRRWEDGEDMDLAAAAEAETQEALPWI